MDKLEKLKQLLILTQNDTLTPKEVEQFLRMVLEFIKTSKDNFEKLSADNLQTIASSIAYIEELSGNVSNDLSSKSSALLGQIEAKIDLLNDTLKEVKAMKLVPGKKGKDADEKKIIKEVLSKIELPKFKETILDNGEQIVGKINDLPTDDDELKIDALHIKNLPKMITNQVGGVVARNIYQMGDVALSSLADGEALVWDATNNRWQNGTAGTSSPLTTKGDLYTFTTENARLGVGTDGQVLVADSTEATGLKWINSSGIVNTLANTSADSTNTASSLYQMTSGVNVEFKTSGAVSRLKLFESGGVEISSADTIISGFTNGLNVKGADPTLRITSGVNGFGQFLSGQTLYFGYTFNNWASVAFGGLQRDYRWSFGGSHQPDSIVHVKAATATDTVIIAQGTTAQTGSLIETRLVNDTVLLKSSPNGDTIFSSASFGTNQGGINIYDAHPDTGGWSYKGIKGTNSSVWSGAKGIVFYEHTEAIGFLSPVSFSSQTGFPGYVWLGGSPYSGAKPAVIVSSTGNYVDFLGMKYATSPYPTVRNSALSHEFYAKSDAAWADGSSLGGTYGTKVLEIIETGVNITGNVGIGTTNPVSKLQINNGTGISQFGAGSSGADIILSSGSAVYTSAIWSSIFGPRGSGEAFSWSDWDGNPLMTLITATGATKGNVGIGTASPSAKLHTKATSASNIVSIFQGTTSQTGNLTEWRDVSNNVKGYVDVSGNTSFVGQISADQYYFNGGSKGAYILNPSDGVLGLYNNAAYGFDRLQFGGTTTSFPAIKRNGTGIDIRLADDSAYTDITAKKVISTDIVRLKGYTVATLPTGTQGDTAFVTDAVTVPAKGVAPTGGGSAVGVVFYDGSAWVGI